MRSSDYVNVIVAHKQQHLQYLDRSAASLHCAKGLGIWEWASTDSGVEPDFVMACAGDGYKEKGNINTPLELAINNQIDRYSLAMDAIDPLGATLRERLPKLMFAGAHSKEQLKNIQLDCLNYAREYGIDKSEIFNWKWLF